MGVGVEGIKGKGMEKARQGKARKGRIKERGDEGITTTYNR